jgi:hypothetical protein
MSSKSIFEEIQMPYLNVKLCTPASTQTYGFVLLTTSILGQCLLAIAFLNLEHVQYPLTSLDSPLTE